MSLWAEGVNELTIPFDLRFSQMRSAVEGRLRSDDPRRSVLRESKNEITYGKLRDLNAQLDLEWREANRLPAEVETIQRQIGDCFRQHHSEVLNHRELRRKLKPLMNSEAHKIAGDLPAGWDEPIEDLKEPSLYRDYEHRREVLAAIQSALADAQSRNAIISNALYLEQLPDTARHETLLRALWAHVKRLEGQIHGLKRYMAENLESKAVGNQGAKRAGKRK